MKYSDIQTVEDANRYLQERRDADLVDIAVKLDTLRAEMGMSITDFALMVPVAVKLLQSQLENEQAAKTTTQSG